MKFGQLVPLLFFSVMSSTNLAKQLCSCYLTSKSLYKILGLQCKWGLWSYVAAYKGFKVICSCIERLKELVISKKSVSHISILEINKVSGRGKQEGLAFLNIRVVAFYLFFLAESISSHVKPMLLFLAESISSYITPMMDLPFQFTK